jgi:hypothetical protein
MTRPAVTSKRVAAIAGRVLEIITTNYMVYKDAHRHVMWSDVRVLAASALRQTEQASSAVTRRLRRAPAASKKAGIKSKRGKWTARKIALRKK